MLVVFVKVTFNFPSKGLIKYIILTLTYFTFLTLCKSSHIFLSPTVTAHKLTTKPPPWPCAFVVAFEAGKETIQGTMSTKVGNEIYYISFTISVLYLGCLRISQSEVANVAREREVWGSLEALLPRGPDRQFKRDEWTFV